MKKAARKPTRKRAPKGPEYDWIAEGLRPLAVPLDRLCADALNAKKHPESNLTAIAASLRIYGQRKPLVANQRTGQVEAGNGTLLAAQSLGWSHIAVVWVDDEPSAARGFAIADNRTAELAQWDLDLLLSQAELVPKDEGLYEALELDLLLADMRPGNSDEESGASPPSAVVSYQLVFDDQGQHDLWLRFLRYLRERYPTLKEATHAGRLTAYIEALHLEE